MWTRRDHSTAAHLVHDDGKTDKAERLGEGVDELELREGLVAVNVHVPEDVPEVRVVMVEQRLQPRASGLRVVAGEAPVGGVDAALPDGSHAVLVPCRRGQEALHRARVGEGVHPLEHRLG